MIGALATENHARRTSQQDDQIMFDSRVAVPLAAAGIITGAVLGYRFSAPTSRAFAWSPSVSRNALALNMYFAL